MDAERLLTSQILLQPFHPPPALSVPKKPIDYFEVHEQGRVREARHLLRGQQGAQAGGGEDQPGGDPDRIFSVRLVGGQDDYKFHFKGSSIQVC